MTRRLQLSAEEAPMRRSMACGLWIGEPPGLLQRGCNTISLIGR